MANAGNGEKYDFKDQGIDERPKGTTEEQYRYRGSATDNGEYGSARDFGNIGAGIVAGRKGLTWNAARLGFDTYQSYKSGRFETEGKTTQKAERYGFSIGCGLRKTDIEKRNSENQIHIFIQ